MASPNSNYTDLIASTLEYMGDEVVDAVTGNNAATAWMKAHDGYKVVEGGRKIIEPVAYAANSNGGYYSGYDQLPLNPQEEFTDSEYDWKQIAVPIVYSGLETDVQNVGRAQRFDLLEERIKNARRSMANIVATGFYSDGTGSGGKQLTGLLAMLSATPTTGTYGGINRATASNAWWRNKYTAVGAISATTCQGFMNTMYYSLVRGTDKPNVILADATAMGGFEASLQTIQRMTDPKMAELGFENIKYKSAAVVMDGNNTASTMFFLNTDFMRLRVAKNRNFKALPKRASWNQDAEAVFLAAACNFTASNAYLLGRLAFA
jgi:hypothetical protein